MKIFEQIQGMGHEQIMFCNDPSTGLKAIIAIHNTVLGPALGGTRFWDYANDTDALTDVLRLSRGMTYKAAAAGLNLGGGKAVIMGNPQQIKSEALLRRFGKFVENLAGKYITAEDVGVNEKDMEHIYAETKHVTGIPETLGGSGDPSPFTAYGVYLGIKACAKKVFGSEDLARKKVLVQGTGKVGSFLVEHLRKEGATVYIYDANTQAMSQVAKKYQALPISADQLFATDAEIFAPCALGGIINPQTLPQMKFAIIAGGANNQLLNEKNDGDELLKKGILYAPDFVINAGGLMNVHTELEGYNQHRSKQKVETIYQKLLDIFDLAGKQNLNPQIAAIQFAEKRIQQIAAIKPFL